MLPRVKGESTEYKNFKIIRNLAYWSIKHNELRKRENISKFIIINDGYICGIKPSLSKYGVNDDQYNRMVNMFKDQTNSSDLSAEVVRLNYGDQIDIREEAEDHLYIWLRISSKQDFMKLFDSINDLLI